ncbi:unnamed protein product [Cylindrotheca closterium]|uniref:Ndc10 domain-containing protein n=1 Tax=Cylindrotheca closterium TaxID=2856 RepID=A0AAD2PXF0_9STRA|nr:unnamed protein product [Cylindrotheca closterium]CAJ1966159.1 unnamed protein product [Cylindrotheca closterium]
MPAQPNGLSDEQEVFLKICLDRVEAARRLKTKGLSDTYLREYQRFVIWVIKNNRMPDPMQRPFRFTTRDNVDKYYIHDFTKREFGTQNSRSRVHQAIQRFWDSVESSFFKDFDTLSPLMDGEAKKFRVKDSEAVEASVIEQQRYYDSIKEDKFGGTDPFKGLKADLLTSTEKMKVMTYILNDRPDWKDIGCSFNWGCNAGLRGDSTRSLCFKDLYISHGFAPGQGRNLTAILRKDDQKSDFTTDRLVGVLRHRHYLLCASFMTSMNVIRILQLRSNEVHFKRPNKKSPAEFWQIPFVDFTKLADEENAMREIYVKTGVESCKVTHHRTHCVMHASTEGLQQYQVSTLTKHMNDKLTKSYWAEMERRTMTVMAGFDMDEAYNVLRTQIGLPLESIEACIRALFGNDIDRWKREQEAPDGDKSTCAQKFFSRLLPFLVEVLVQDGIYLIIDHPQHEMSIMLHNKIPGYAQWAAMKRRWVKNELLTFEPKKMEALNSATQNAFQSIMRQVKYLEDAVVAGATKNQALTEQVEALRQELRNRNQEFNAVQQRRDDAMRHFIAQELRNVVGNHQIQNHGPPTGTGAPSQQEVHTRAVGNVSATQPLRETAEILVAPETQQRPPSQRQQALQRSTAAPTVVHLQSIPHQPALGKAFPKLWSGILQNWINLKLEKFIHVPKNGRNGWNNAENAKRFHKHYRGFLCIQSVMEENETVKDLKGAAFFLDDERRSLKLNMTEHLQFRCKRNPSIQSKTMKKQAPKSNNTGRGTKRPNGDGGTTVQHPRNKRSRPNSNGNGRPPLPPFHPVQPMQQHRQQRVAGLNMHQLAYGSKVVDIEANRGIRGVAQRYQQRTMAVSQFTNSRNSAYHTTNLLARKPAAIQRRRIQSAIGPGGKRARNNLLQATVAPMADQRFQEAVAGLTPDEYLEHADAIRQKKVAIAASVLAEVNNNNNNNSRLVCRQSINPAHLCPIEGCNGDVPEGGGSTMPPIHKCYNIRNCNKKVHHVCADRSGLHGRNEMNVYCSIECREMRPD